MSKTTGFQTERTKPFPVDKLDFSKNEITAEGIGGVVQFARTQGSDATKIDLSRNRLDDQAAVDEVTRLVKNYSSFAANAFISELILTGNNIGKAGARAAPAHRPPRALSRAAPTPRPRPSPPRSLQARASSSSMRTGSATASRRMPTRRRR